METRAGWIPGVLLWLWLAPAFLFAAAPDSWVPARWDGGPLEVVRRTGDKALSDPAVREAIANWYSPVTLGLLDGSPVNCLLLTLSAGADPASRNSSGNSSKSTRVRLANAGLRFWAWFIQKPIRPLLPPPPLMRDWMAW